MALSKRYGEEPSKKEICNAYWRGAGTVDWLQQSSKKLLWMFGGTAIFAKQWRGPEALFLKRDEDAERAIRQTKQFPRDETDTQSVRRKNIIVRATVVLSVRWAVRNDFVREAGSMIYKKRISILREVMWRIRDLERFWVSVVNVWTMGKRAKGW